MDDLIKLINFILNAYNSINKKWNNSHFYIPYDMKKLRVDKVYNDSDFINYVINYCKFISDNMFEIARGLSNLNICEFRVKHLNSLQDKILRYVRQNHHENGKVSVNKCLNDLFGIRIIVDDNISFTDINKMINEKFPYLKCIEARRKEYYAVHVYFRDDDKTKFQWELQIWNLKNAKNNYKSHEKYKQEYTKWENNIKEDEKYV